MDGNPALEARGPASVFNIFAHMEDREGPGLANAEGFHRFSSLLVQFPNCEFGRISFENRNPALHDSVKTFFLGRDGLPHDEMCERPSDTVHKDISSALCVCLFDLLIGQLEFVLNTHSYLFHRLFGLVGYNLKNW
jgi:hypothetical protein